MERHVAIWEIFLYSRNITVYLSDSMICKGAYKKHIKTALRELLPGRCDYKKIRKGVNEYGKHGKQQLI
jgi:hypothetical protein